MVTSDDVRALALSLPRAYEALVGDRVKFRVRQLVFLALSPDETVLGFGYPKEERDALIASEPGKFQAAGPVRPAVQLDAGPAGRDRARRAAADRGGVLADVRAEEGVRRVPGQPAAAAPVARACAGTA
jgi:hypothetical protein